MAKKTVKNFFTPPKSKTSFSDGNKSAGILDDFAVRKDIEVLQGNINTTPTLDKNIVNKKYVDDEIGTYTDDLRDDSMADALHRHSELSASDGTPNPAVSVDAVGNVGIGTTSPDGTLHVHTSSAGAVTADATADDLVVEKGGAAGGITILTDDARDTNLFFGTTSDNSGVIQRWEHHADLFSLGTAKADAELRLLTGNFVEAMRIDSSGKVGIGTTAPADKLHVYEDTANVAASSGLTIEQDGAGDATLHLLLTATRRWQVGIDNSDADKFKISHQNFAVGSDLAIDASGNVGIGVTDPHSLLEVNGAISSATSTFSTTGPTDNVDVSGINTLFVTTGSGAVTIGGFAGGVAGQVLHVVKKDSGSVTLEYNEGGGSQDIFLKSEVDETIETYGGWVLVCDGSNWYDSENSK